MNKLFSAFLFSLSFLLVSTHAANSSGSEQPHAPLPDNLSSKIQGNYFIYEGYRFDISQISNDEHLKDILSQLAWQVYFVNVLHLPQEIQDFFKSVPVVVVTSDNARELSDYNDTTSKTITLFTNELLDLQSFWISSRFECTAFLELLLMAFLDEHFSEGTNNPDLVKYFQQAKSLACYQKKKPTWLTGNFSTNDAISWFFADAAIAYLRGSHWEEPSSYYVIQKNQPEFFHYLEKLFGPKSGFINQSFSYHGFHFNCSEMDDFSKYEEVRKTCMRQVDYIESTRVSQNVMDFFKSVPLKLRPDYQMVGVGGLRALGTYLSVYKSISLNASNAAFNFLYAGKPDVTLLHELLHAFQDQVLLDGNNNPYISKFYQEAVEHRYYYDFKNNLNYWMTNKYEFFACTATAFLDNYTPDEPFKRRNICKYQPDYYLYLQGIFGTNHDDMGIVERSLIANAVDHLY